MLHTYIHSSVTLNNLANESDVKKKKLLSRNNLTDGLPPPTPAHTPLPTPHPTRNDVCVNIDLLYIAKGSETKVPWETELNIGLSSYTLEIRKDFWH